MTAASSVLTVAAPRRLGVRTAVAAWAGLVLVFAVLLSPVVPRDAREAVTGLGLLVAGVLATACGVAKARRSEPADAAPWWLLVAGGVVLLVGNGWSAATGADPVTSPSLLTNVCIATALLLVMAALVVFPGVERRGVELLVMVLDGVVTGGAVMLVCAALVYPELLDPGAQVAGDAANRTLALVFPGLDVLLITLAVLLVLRARRRDRLMLVLVAAAFLMYAASDLPFAVLTAEGTFRFGSLVDLGWIAGYLTLGLAAVVPTYRTTGPRGEGVSVSDVLGTLLVFGALAAATVSEVLSGGTGRLETVQSALWVAIVVAAGLRQAILTFDNAALRRGLERRVAEQTADLRSLARQNEVLITSVGDGVYGVDHQGRVTFVNPSAARMLGWAAADLAGRPAHDTFHAPADDGTPYPWTGCYVHEAIAHGVHAVAEEDEYVRADGTRFAVEITASPLLEDSSVRGAVVTFRDVTQRREVERMKNEFLSVVSHELRTPLTSIRGSLGLLGGGRLGELPERAASLVSVALQSSERLTRLINDLLDLERMESGAKPMEQVALDAHHLLDLAARQIEGMAAQAGVRVVVEDAPGRVLADEDRIIQTLLNLLGNAIKFSEPGSTVRLSSYVAGPDVCFRVADTGRGIPADKLETVFERFAQVDSSDTRQKGGTGLGLTISRGIVEKHGGRIWAESEPGRGTTVSFTLPAARRVTGDLVDAPERDEAPCVLVCDDDEAVVQQFCALLRLHDFRAVGVTDGARAVEVARRERPDALVLDLMMPGTTGAEVLHALKGDETTSDIPVVVISGLRPEADAEVARESEQWLVKPVSETRLVDAVSLAVAGRRAGGRVLLVEDDEGLAAVLGTVLGDAGLGVVHASSAHEAVEVTEAQPPPDVIVLDLRLPDGTGEDVVAALRARWSLARTPLVVYSAVDVDASRRDQLHLGPTVFLNKGETGPEVLRDQVLALVRAVTTGRSRTTA